MCYRRQPLSMGTAISTTRLLAAGSLCLVACASRGAAGRPAAGSPPAAALAVSASQAKSPPGVFPAALALSSEALIAAHGTGQETYALTGAAWLPGAPVAVNEDYDFATALGLEAGAGIAAGKRLRANRDKAASLAGFALAKKTLAALDAARARGVHVYVILWGPAEAAEARVVTDRFDRQRHLVRSTSTALSARPLTGTEGWSAARHVLEDAIAAVLSAGAGSLQTRR